MRSGLLETVSAPNQHPPLSVFARMVEAYGAQTTVLKGGSATEVDFGAQQLSGMIPSEEGDVGQQLAMLFAGNGQSYALIKLFSLKGKGLPRAVAFVRLPHDDTERPEVLKFLKPDDPEGLVTKREEGWAFSVGLSGDRSSRIDKVTVKYAGAEPLEVTGADHLGVATADPLPHQSWTIPASQAREALQMPGYVKLSL